MKKTLLILCALLLTAIGASAQTDVTEQYIQNPSFEESDTTKLTADETRGYQREEDGAYTGAYTITAEDLSETGWTLTGESNLDIIDIMTKDAKETDNYLGVPGEAADGDCMLYLKKTWTGDNTLQASVKQTVELPAGTYKLTVDSKCFTGGASANLVAGSASNAITINGTAAGSETSHPMTALTEWTTNELTFIVTPEEDQETAEVEIGVEFTLTNNSPGSFVLDNFKLYSMEVEYDNNVTWKLANPSFEVDNVAYLTEDATRSETTDGEHTGGAYTIANGLTGWTLEAPTSTTTDRAISDLLTVACQRTDNSYGAPGTPTDGSQMLYLRCAWESKTGSVTQVVSLPEGEYKLTVDSKCVTTGEGHSAVLVVDETSISLPVHSSYNELDWDTTSLIFEVGEGGADVTIGVKATFAGVSAGLSVALDNFKLYAAEAITEEITWTMTEAGWGTMILPFTPTSIPSGLTLYAGDALTIDGSTITVDTEATSIAANTAYLVKGTAGSYSFSGTPANEGEIHTTGLLTGTLVDLAVGTGAAFATDGTQYLLQNHEDEDVAFYPITSDSAPTEEAEGASLDAYHCYLTVSAEESDEGEPAKLSIVLPGAGEETGIVAVEGAEAEADGAIYDLSGRRVAKAVKGVYIQNGKKVLVK